MTNYEMIKNYTIDELAEFILDLGNGSEYSCGCCAYEHIQIDGEDCNEKCFEGVKKWLKSEVEDDEIKDIDRFLDEMFGDDDE